MPQRNDFLYHSLAMSCHHYLQFNCPCLCEEKTLVGKEVPEKSVLNIGLKQKIIPTDEEKTQGQQKNAKTEAIGVKNSSFRCEI